MLARTYPAVHRFLKYEDPQVMAPDEPDPPEEISVEWMKFWLFRTSDMRFIPDPRLVDYVAEYKRCLRKEIPPTIRTEDFLEVLFPTKYWMENGIRYTQKVSLEIVDRGELVAMKDLLDHEMILRQSQATSGYCPIRFALHMELFDELIRQVAIESPSRAYMLERVRVELNQTREAYKKVLDVSLVEESKIKDDQMDGELQLMSKKLDDVQAELKAAEEENLSLNSDYRELLYKYELFERVQTQLHEPEIEFAKRISAALERQLFHFENPPNFDADEDEPLPY